MLNEIKFQGNPPNKIPLKYSKIESESEKIKIELKFILTLKNLSESENSP